ncbi:MAG: hypothetical protein WCT04_15945 [Planctomycetota bacterium]
MRVRGLTLFELLLVVALLVALASAVLPRLNDVADHSQSVATQESMRTVRDAIRGTNDDPGYVGTVGQLPDKIDDLFMNHAGVSPYNPLTKKGFRSNGYLQFAGTVYKLNFSAGFTTDYCYNDGIDSAVFDAWKNPIVIQSLPGKPKVKRLLSAGPDGILETPATSSTPVGDDIILSLNPDGVAW